VTVGAEAKALGPRFVSTRAPAEEGVDLPTALRRGLAPDGGLYVPGTVPAIREDWREVGSLADAATAVLAPFVPPEHASVWLGDVREALDFPVPLRRLDADTYLLELFHGPTGAFKDVAARVMGRWWRRLLQPGERAVVLVATSGDTGGAVADGLAGIPGLEVVVLFPADGVSPVQRAQLTAVRPGVHAFAVQGTFDDAQRLVKEAFRDPALADLPLTSANSINLARWLPQASFHVWGLAQLAQQGVVPERAVVVVPSGNLGNLVAGLYAAAMGAAPAAFVAAHNVNDYVVERLAGRRAPFDFSPTVPTYSNAMDVGAPSNYERFEALWSDRPPVPVRGVRVDDATTLEGIERAYAEWGLAVCPHTAVGLEAARVDRRQQGDDAPRLVFATAHAAKFPEVVARALPNVPVVDPRLSALQEGPQRERPLAPTLAALRTALRDLSD
jgi:threonine synthase